MTYVMSDLHGSYEKFIKMLSEISFSKDDTLYILGDIIDRGEGGVKLLQELSMMPNVFPILGNHELMALEVLEPLLQEITEENYDTTLTPDLLLKMLHWQQDGGDVTLKQFKALPVEERFALLDYLKDFSPYETVDFETKSYLLVHSFPEAPLEKPFGAHTAMELTCARPDYDVPPFRDPDVFVVCGHTPTKLLCGKWEIFRKNNYINIDCGASFSGYLSCLRLEDQAEFYV